jgi:molecular chaperone DnaJ
VNLTREQRALLEEFRSGLKAGGEQQSPRQTSWFEGVKKFFDGMTG